MAANLVPMILAGGLLAAFFALRSRERARGIDYWLAAWSVIYLAGLLDLGTTYHVTFAAVAVLVGTLHPALLFDGACELVARPAPRWLLPAVMGLAVIRGGLVLLGYRPFVLLSFVPIALALELGSGWIIWRNSPGSRPRRQILSVLFVVYAAAHGFWLVDTALATTSRDLLASVWMGAAMVLILGQFMVLAHEQHTAQRNLVLLNERLGRMLEGSSDFAAWADAEGELRYVNPALMARTGLDEAEIPGLHLASLLSPDSAHRLQSEAWPRAMAGDTWQGDLELRSAGGRLLPVSAVVVPQRDQLGNVEAIGSLMRDLTDRTRIEEELRRRVAFEHRVASISTEFLMRDPEDLDVTLSDTLEAIGRFVGAHRAWIFLLRDGDLSFTVSHRWQADDLPPESGVLDGATSAELPWLFQQLRNGSVVSLDEKTLPPEAVADRRLLEGENGCDLAFVPLRLGTNLLGCLAIEQQKGHCIAEDELAPVRLAADFVTNALAHRRSAQVIHEREAELRQAQKMEAVGQLAGGVAHDFNNLLTVISGYSEVLQTDSGLSDRQREEVEQIRLAAARASSLTSQLLAFSRRQILEPHPFDLNQRVSGLEAMLRRTVGERIHLTTDLAPNLPLARADPSQFDQVVVNLVVNARDAIAGDGTIQLSTALVPGREDSTGRHPGWIRLSVVDDGCGMSAATRSRIFEPFFTTKRPGAGTGLGLSTAYGILSQSGGGIEVLSQEGAGTTVHVRIPVASDVASVAIESGGKADSATESQSGESSRALDRTRSGTLLLVEDEAKVRDLLRSILEGEGFQVIEAADGKEALALVESEAADLDLVITDVVMPHLGGPELVAELRARRGPVPALFLSGYPDRYGRATELPGLFLEKPFTRSELVAAIDSLIPSATAHRTA